MTTTTKTSARVMATDEKTGRRYVKTQTVEGATVTVTKFVGQEVGGTYRWTSALYDVTSPAGELFARAVKWDGQHWKVGSKVAPSLTKAVRAVLGTGQPPPPRQGRQAVDPDAQERCHPQGREGRGRRRVRQRSHRDRPRHGPAPHPARGPGQGGRHRGRAARQERGGGQVSRPEPDPVARAIALTVQHHLITSPERPDLPELPAEVTRMEAHRSATGYRGGRHDG